MKVETKLTSKDLFDFKRALIGSGYGTPEPFQLIFGLSRSVYYSLEKNPEKVLQPWHASHLRVYRALPYSELIQVIHKAHGIDVREIKR